MVNHHSDIRKLREYAKKNNVPIMQNEGMKFLTNFIIKNKINTVLEIGTAIGYSAIMMALANPSLKIITIEKDEDRYLEALKNVKIFDLEDRITLIYNDALDVKLDNQFDLIFIDAAKGKNMVFFDKFERNLNDDGFIITDNMNLHGYVKMEENEIKNRNLRQLVRKIKDYIKFLENNIRYKTEFYELGDGIAVSHRR